MVRRGWLAGLSRCPKACPNEVAPEDDVQPANYINKVTVAVSTNIETHHLPGATERETKVQTTFYFLQTLVPNYLNKRLANFVVLCTKTKKKTLSAKFASCTCASVSCFISFNRRWASMLVEPALCNYCYMLSTMAILLPNQQVVVYTALSLAFVRVGNDHASGVFCGSYLFKLNLIVKLKVPQD